MKILKILRKVARYTTAMVLMVTGILGIGVIFYDPSSYLSTYIPEATLSPIVTSFYADPMIWGGTIAASVVVMLLAFIMLVQNPRCALRSIWKGIKAAPGSYKKIATFRDWSLAKIDYLQTESAKWRRAFQVLKSPYSLLRAMGFSPQMAVGLIFAGSTVGTGVVVNETILAERSFSNGDSGVYSAPLDVPTEYVEGENTLRIDLGSTPVREITIENVSVGTVFTGSALPSGEANVVQISGNTISGGTNTRLEVGHFIFEKSRCKKLTLTDIQAHTIKVVGNASDGQSLAPSPGTSRMRAIGGGHQQADAMTTNGGTYDRIWIQAPTSGVNGKVGILRLTNLYTKGGDCVISKMNVGTMDILLNEVGMGNGFSTKEFTIATNVTGANITVSDNVEVSISEPTTAGH
jgi:hypothetical protein